MTTGLPKRLYSATVEVVVVFASDGGDLGYQAEEFAREDISSGGGRTSVREVRCVEDIPPEWRDQGRKTPLVWGDDGNLTATAWLAAHPYVPTESELEAAGQLSLLGAP